MIRRITIQFCIFASLMILLLIITSCYSEPEFAVKDKREVQGEKKVELFRRDNRGGIASLIEDVSIVKQFSRSIDLNLEPKSNLDEGKVREKIYNSYKVQRESVKTCVIPVEVPAGKANEYGLEWAQILREGVIEEGATGGGKQLGTYRIQMDMNCQVVSVTTLASQ